MPGFDGTGPSGLGSMTGRGLGRCAVNQQGEFLPAGGGRGRGRGRGFRQRFCRNINYTPPVQQDVSQPVDSNPESLENKVLNIEGTLSSMQKQLEILLQSKQTDE